MARTMLKDYRAWLESELKLLGNASHHAYSFGQANMAKRAIERLDAELAGKVDLLLDSAAAAELLAFLHGEAAKGDLPGGASTARAALAEALKPA